MPNSLQHSATIEQFQRSEKRSIYRAMFGSQRNRSRAERWAKGSRPFGECWKNINNVARMDVAPSSFSSDLLNAYRNYPFRVKVVVTLSARIMHTFYYCLRIKVYSPLFLLQILYYFLQSDGAIVANFLSVPVGTQYSYSIVR